MATDGSDSRAKDNATVLPKCNILLGCSGSVASIKVPALVDALKALNEVSVEVIVTEHAAHFFDPIALPVKVHKNINEWELWQQRGDPVLHIELRRWADILVIAPLDANTLAKIANGLCDNLLTCVVRAWDLRKPLLYAPAMNTAMWHHPITAQHIDCLHRWNYTEIECVEKTLICGDTGFGAMAEIDTIVDIVRKTIHQKMPS